MKALASVLVLLVTSCAADADRWTEVRLWRRDGDETRVLQRQSTGLVTVGADGAAQTPTLLARTDCAGGLLVGELDDGRALGERRADVAMWRPDGTVTRLATDVGRVAVADLAADSGTACVRFGDSASGTGGARAWVVGVTGDATDLGTVEGGVRSCTPLAGVALVDVRDGEKGELRALNGESVSLVASTGAVSVFPSGDRRSAAVLVDPDYGGLRATLGAVTVDGGVRWTASDSVVRPWPTVTEDGLIVSVAVAESGPAGAVSLWRPGNEPTSVAGATASAAWVATTTTDGAAAVLGGLVSCEVAALDGAFPTLDGKCDLARIDGAAAAPLGLTHVRARLFGTRQVVVTGYEAGAGTGVTAIDLAKGEQISVEAAGAASGFLLSCSTLMPVALLTVPATTAGYPVTVATDAEAALGRPALYVTQVRGNQANSGETVELSTTSFESMYITSLDAEKVTRQTVFAGDGASAVDYTTPIESRANADGRVQCVLYAAYISE